jgi:integrase
LNKYLCKRAGSPNWQLRMAVPVSLRQRLGKEEVTRSLRTADRALAEARALEAIVDVRRSWSQLGEPVPESISRSGKNQGSHVPDDWELEDAAADAGYRILAESFGQGRIDAAKDPVLWAAYVERRATRLAHWERLYAGEQWEAWEELADGLIERRSWDIAKGSDRYRAFLKLGAGAFIDGLRKIDAANSVRPEPAPMSVAVQRSTERAMSAGEKSETIVDMLERYAGRRRADGMRDAKIIAIFADFVGRQRDVKSITAVDVRDFRDLLARTPKGYTKRNDYKGLSLREAAAKAQQCSDQVMSTTTVSKYMSIVSPFFAWLKRDTYIDSNPFDGMHVKPPKGQNRRPPFSIAEINRIVSSPIFVGFDRKGKEHIPGTQITRDWRFWIPLICMFTGARVGEVAQLRSEDIIKQKGWWFFTLKEDVERGQRVKNRKSRLVAVHPMLDRIGLLKHVADLRQSGNEGPLFPELSANERGHIGSAPSRFFRDYLTRIGLKSGPDGKGMHSFRHTLADQLRMAGNLDTEIGGLVLGHTNSLTATTAGYGAISQGTAQRLYDTIASAAFEGVDFEHLVGGSNGKN